MRILVLVREGTDGEISPFEASALECALCIENAEVILMSMGPKKAQNTLKKLSRLGCRRAILLCDTAFAGADTLATAYTLSLAVKKINPDLIFCGRKTLVGDTAQTGPMLSHFCGTSLITEVMSVDTLSDKTITCTTRTLGQKTATFPALLTLERIKDLRFASIFSKECEVEIFDAATLCADKTKCGFEGSPTRVLKTSENKSGKRKCRFISPKEFSEIYNAALNTKKAEEKTVSGEKMTDTVLCVGTSPLDFAKSVGDKVKVTELADAETMEKIIENEKPAAVIWGSDAASKEISALTAAKMGLGLCADCTALEYKDGELIMHRPALSGSIMAQIKSLTKPAMCTVRTEKTDADAVITVGFGAKEYKEEIFRFAQNHGAVLGATRKAVDNDVMPYAAQIGLTGKTVSPKVYVTFGVSGAVHHLVGFEHAATVIAVNSDKDAPIFDYADFGVVCDGKDLLSWVNK